MQKFLTALCLALAGPVMLAIPATQAMAQDAIRSERVNFAPGRSGTVINRTIRGRETIDFLVNAREGQSLTVSMSSNNTAAYFNLIAPDERDVAFYVGANSSPANSYTGAVPKSGDLKIRVYLYRAAARRGETASIRLSMSVTGSGGTATHLPGTLPDNGGAASQLPGDALVPGTPYHATGILSCIVRSNGPVGDCRFGVIRLGGGSAAVTIAKLDGRSRTIVYRQGVPIGFDQASGEPGGLSWTREGDQTTVQIGGERYYVPDAIPFGG